MPSATATAKLFDPQIVSQAALDALVKLDPRKQHRVAGFPARDGLEIRLNPAATRAGDRSDAASLGRAFG